MKTTLYHQLRSTNESYSEKQCLTEGQRNWTFAELLADVDSCADTLARTGVVQGSRMLYVAGRGANTLILFLAASKLGVLFATLDSRADHKKNQAILDQYQADLVLFSDKQAKPDDYDLGHYQQVDLTDNLNSSGWLSLQFIDDASQYRPSRSPVGSDIGLVFFTSGSTGQAKGVALSHRSVLFAAESISEYLQLSNQDVIYNALPLNFDYGFYQLLFPLFTGAHTILSNSFLIPQKNLLEIERSGTTVFPIVPSMARLIKRAAYANALDKVRKITNTGEAIHSEEVLSLESTFPNASFYSMYGLTECKRTSWLPPHEYRLKPNSVGIAIPGTRIEILDEHHLPVPPGVEGQVVVSGPHLMTEYLDNPEATRKALFYDPIDKQTKLATGDFGHMDAEGYLYLSGRRDEVFKIDGLKYSCSEHTQWIKSFSEIRDACVLVQPATLAITAFIVEEAGATISDKSIRTRLLQRCALSSHIPEKIIRLSDIPINDNGKHDKKRLKQGDYQDYLIDDTDIATLESATP